MNRKLLEDLIKQDPDNFELLSVGDKEFYFLKEEKDQNDRLEYIDIVGKNKIDKIVDQMVQDTQFRHFMLVNLQGVLQALRKLKQGASPKYNCILRRQEEMGEDNLYQITTRDYVGFANDDIPDSFAESLNSQTIDFIGDLTHEFRCEISHISKGSRKHFQEVNAITDIIKQVEKLVNVAGFTKDNILITEKTALIKDSFDDEKTRAFFSAWQLNIFFEQFIAKFIEKQTGNKCLINKKLCVLPNRSNEYQNGLLEIDVLGYNKNNEVILIECKNGQLRESEISKFIGRSKIIESTYEIKIPTKIIVGTKYIDRFFDPIERGTKIIDINWFDNKHYRKYKCYTDLAALVGNNQ